MAGCGSPVTHLPSQPAAHASTTSAAPSPSTTATASAGGGADTTPTNLAASTLYGELTRADQATVARDLKLSFKDFLNLGYAERAKVSSVITDAHIKVTLAKYRTDPTFGSYIDSDWNVGQNPTRTSLIANTDGPTVNVWFKQATAFNMAASGNPALFEDAKKILAGTVQYASPSDNGGSKTLTGGYEEQTQELQDVFTAKADTVSRYPGTAGGTSNVSPLGGVLFTVEMQMPDSTLAQYCMRDASFTLADGRTQGDWVIASLTHPGELGFYTDLKHYR